MVIFNNDPETAGEHDWDWASEWEYVNEGDEDLDENDEDLDENAEDLDETDEELERKLSDYENRRFAGGGSRSHVVDPIKKPPYTGGGFSGLIGPGKVL